MIRVSTKIRSCLLAVTVLALASSPALAGKALDLLTTVETPSGDAEITAVDGLTGKIFITGSDGLDVLRWAGGANVVPGAAIDMTGVLGGEAIDGLSSVAIDPCKRGFGVATVIPDPSQDRVGVAVIFSTITGDIINVVETGFHPDMVTFNADGSKVLIANEGETNEAELDTPGGISTFDLPRCRRGWFRWFSVLRTYIKLYTMGDHHVKTATFEPQFLAPGVTLDELRIVNPDNIDNGTEYLDPEPEYITVEGHLAYVALQESNAVGVYDCRRCKWVKIIPLGTITQTVDASDRDGPDESQSILIDDVVKGLPMPDAIASFTTGRGWRKTTYLMTANEGDGRGDIDDDGTFNRYGDELRVKDNDDAVTGGTLPAIDPTYLGTLDALYPSGDATDDENLGRLTISGIDGLGADGEIESLHMYGTRSFTIWNAKTGAIVFDSGDSADTNFEDIVADLTPELFNSDESDPEEFDKRSDNKGPEPEGIATAKIDGYQLAFVGLERSGGIVAFDVSDPANAEFLQYANNGAAGPEGLVVVTGDNSPDGKDYLIVSYEDSGEVEIHEIVDAD